ncbi:MAG: DUF559 domain-containing protein [Patescibacteria group bacterium]|jgi:very-short-patch-repair endonuclease
MDQKGKFVTPQAKKLQEALENRGVKVEIEHFDGHKHVDLFLPEARVNIEVDGLWHLANSEQIIRDFNREYHDDRKGYNTLHIQNVVIDHHLKEIVEGIAEMVLKRKLDFLSKA